MGVQNTNSNGIPCTQIHRYFILLNLPLSPGTSISEMIHSLMSDLKVVLYKLFMCIITQTRLLLSLSFVHTHRQRHSFCTVLKWVQCSLVVLFARNVKKIKDAASKTVTLVVRVKEALTN